MVRALNGDPARPAERHPRAQRLRRGRHRPHLVRAFNVDPQGQNEITLGATLRRGVKGAVALVGRTRRRQQRHLHRADQAPAARRRRPGQADERDDYSRVTAVAAERRHAQVGLLARHGDWLWVNDDEPITLAAQRLHAAACASLRAQARRPPGRPAQPRSRSSSTRASPASTTRNIRITGPGGKRVRFDVTQSSDGATCVKPPDAALWRQQRYTVTLANAVTDGGGNRLPRVAAQVAFQDAPLAGLCTSGARGSPRRDPGYDGPSRRRRPCVPPRRMTTFISDQQARRLADIEARTPSGLGDVQRQPAGTPRAGL